ESHRKIMRLEIEKEALKKDIEASSGNKKAQDRKKAIDKEIAELRDKTRELEIKWKNEKESLQEIASMKKEIDTLRVEAENAELQTDLGRVAEIRYGKIPALEKKMQTKQEKLRKTQRTERIL